MYAKLSNFGPYASRPDELAQCILGGLDAEFTFPESSRTFGRGSKHCADLLAERCAGCWDGLCEAVSQRSERAYTDETVTCCADGPCPYLTAGQQLVRDTAIRKYTVHSRWDKVSCQPFDPLRAESSAICTKMGARQFGLSQAQIAALDTDVVMYKVLQNPQIAPEVLRGIFVFLKRMSIFSQISGTELGKFYAANGWK